MRLAIILLLLLLVRGYTSFAQKEAWMDSIDSQLERSKGIILSHPNEAMAMVQSALALAQKKDYKLGQAKANKALTRLFAQRGDYNQALAANHKALNLFQTLNNPREICALYISLGVINRYLKLFNESIEANLKAEKLAQENGYRDLESAVYGNLGNVYFDKNETGQALKYHLKCLTINTELRDEQGMSNTFHNIGMIHRKRKEYTSALEYYGKSFQIDSVNGNQENIGLSCMEFVETYMEMGDFKKAQIYAEKALAIGLSSNSKRLRSKALFHLPVIYAALGHPEKSIIYQKQYTQLTDSLQSETISEQMAEMQARFQAEQKDKELKLQNLQLEGQQDSIDKQRFLLIALIVLVLSGVFITFLLFNRYNLQQKNQKLSLENEQLQLTKALQLRQGIDEIIHYFSASLYGKNTVEEILWDVVKNCISKLGFVDCVIYLLDEEQNVLIQKAAFGSKNPEDYTILDPIRIPLGKGIVGSVAMTGRAEIVGDTTHDPRYLTDDQRRYSELAVPLVLQDKVIGVIDSEHPDKNFFTNEHLEALKTIAAICSSKIAKAQADDEGRKAKLIRLEAEHIKKLDVIKSQFFANISHEFRTPLHLILAPLQKKEEEISMQEVSMMERNAYRLLRLVNQLLDLTKAEVGMLRLDLRKGDVIYFLRNIASSFTALTENKGISYHIDLPDQEVVGLFDPDKVEKIVYNLLSNAIKFTPAGGEITFTSSLLPDDLLQIVVSDSGLGVPEHLQEKIFDRFYQVDSTQTRAFEGTGIGLALTKELVDLCKGSIRYDEPEHQGSAFVVTLPLVYENVEHTNMPVQVIANGSESVLFKSGATVTESVENGAREVENDGKQSVLLVEDHEELRNYLRNQLSENFQVLVARDGEEGLAMARKAIPDLIITDVMMPVMDGVTLTRYLKEDNLTSHIPVIMLTAKDDVATKRGGFEMGAEQYLAKPFDYGELLARINSLLNQRNRLRVKYSREVILQPTAMTIPDREAAFLEKVIHIIEMHLVDENFTVDVLQKEIGMSRMQLHRKLKALTDQSASDFIRSIRLKRAADLLRQPGFQISEAAYLAGFSHMSYFSKCFKEQFGVLPSEYARQVD